MFLRRFLEVVDIKHCSFAQGHKEVSHSRHEQEFEERNAAWSYKLMNL